MVISHFHADHVNGLLMADNTKAFPNAEILVPRERVEFLDGRRERSRAPKGRMTELFANNRRVFGALSREVTPYAWDKEIVPGVTAVGHARPQHRPHVLCREFRRQDGVRAVRRLQ